MAQYITRTIQFTSSGVAYSTTMKEAQFGTRGPARGRRWYTCIMCGQDYPVEKVILKGGKAYCIPLKDYLDMPEYERAERGRAEPSRHDRRYGGG